MPATAVIQDGAYIVALAIRQTGAHADALVRYPAAALSKGTSANANGGGKARGRVLESALGLGGPVFVVDDAGTECSLHWAAHTKPFICVAS